MNFLIKNRKYNLPSPDYDPTESNIKIRASKYICLSYYNSLHAQFQDTSLLTSFSFESFYRKFTRNNIRFCLFFELLDFSQKNISIYHKNIIKLFYAYKQKTN